MATLSAIENIQQQIATRPRREVIEAYLSRPLTNAELVHLADVTNPKERETREAALAHPLTEAELATLGDMDKPIDRLVSEAEALVMDTVLNNYLQAGIFDQNWPVMQQYIDPAAFYISITGDFWVGKPDIVAGTDAQLAQIPKGNYSKVVGFHRDRRTNKATLEVINEYTAMGGKVYRIMNYSVIYLGLNGLLSGFIDLANMMQFNERIAEYLITDTKNGGDAGSTFLRANITAMSQKFHRWFVGTFDSHFVETHSKIVKALESERAAIEDKK